MPADPDPGPLDALGMKYDTDKASRMVRQERELPGHDYLRHYEAAIRAMDRAPELVLDLGAGPPPREFASARMWAEYLPDAKVVAVDIRKLEDAVPPGIEFIRGDLGDVGFVASLAGRYRPDLIVEDASHRWGHQLLSLFHFLPVVRPGGLYIWEDLHVSGPRYAKRYAEGEGYSPVDFLELLSREVVLSHVAESGKERQAAKAQPQPPSGDDADADSEAPPDAAMPPTESRGLPEMMASALAPLIDRVTIVSSAAIFTRREPRVAPQQMPRAGRPRWGSR